MACSEKPSAVVALRPDAEVKPPAEVATKRGDAPRSDAAPAARQSRRITIQSMPPGAQVLVADKTVGKTPLRMELDSKLPSVSVTLLKKGYRRVVTSLSPSGPEVVKIPLEPVGAKWVDPFDPAPSKKQDTKQQDKKQATKQQDKKGTIPRKGSKTLVNPFEDE